MELRPNNDNIQENILLNFVIFPEKEPVFYRKQVLFHF
ncbi:hypothetical protein B4083_2258 [Bacillus cereus]|nr:hypothetical protein B4083_2258 [Bacillus cereus]